MYHHLEISILIYLNLHSLHSRKLVVRRFNVGIITQNNGSESDVGKTAYITMGNALLKIEHVVKFDDTQSSFCVRPIEVIKNGVRPKSLYTSPEADTAT